jgi:hypothetical protein
MITRAESPVYLRAIDEGGPFEHPASAGSTSRGGGHGRCAPEEREHPAPDVGRVASVAHELGNGGAAAGCGREGTRLHLVA